MSTHPTTLLQVKDLVAGYGKKQILNGVSMEVGSAEIVALIGHNGAGKSTLLKAVFGMIPMKGQLRLDNKAMEATTPQKLLLRGVAYVPQGNRVFTDLSVKENLEVAGNTLLDKIEIIDGIEKVLIWFPVLRDLLMRRAGTLSGGEKQMLALANGLVTSPRLLLLDEPSLGLAPPLIYEALQRIKTISQEKGVTVLIVEQKVREVLKIAHRVYVLRNGVVSFTGSSFTLFDDKILREVYL
jgi:ABC-type branched-subunit amino acid transport system ATPase component